MAVGARADWAKKVMTFYGLHNSSSSGSSSSGRNEYYLGGVIALLLQDHRTMSLKSVCSSQHMVTDELFTVLKRPCLQYLGVNTCLGNTMTIIK